MLKVVSLDTEEERKWKRRACMKATNIVQVDERRDQADDDEMTVR